MSAQVRAGIIGGAGYTGGELLRLLLLHPDVEVAWVQSTSNAGRPVAAVHEGLWGDTDMVFVAEADLSRVDVVFLCSGHGFSEAYWQEHPLPAHLRVIDLAQDFRDEHGGYVYGLPEYNRARISSSSLIANPGCFATAIQLALLPLAEAGLLRGEVEVVGMTGSTGAGVKPGATTHFSWRDNNVSAYKVFGHQHLLEIRRTLAQAGGAEPQINFVPMRGPFPRGIYVNAWLDAAGATAEQVAELYRRRYEAEPFTHYIDAPLDLKQAVNTNKALVHADVIGSKIFVTAVIDNLLKGASGQAVQNMNIIFGLDETAGLRLKPQGF